jgi:predicted MPP superfamily phosphohydrolase
VIFLGDYIDRGPEIQKVLQIVRGMVDRGNAIALMGNHEFNAMASHAPDGKGDFYANIARKKSRNTGQRWNNSPRPIPKCGKAG